MICYCYISKNNPDMRSDSQDQRNSDSANVSTLLSTNRSLIRRKKQQVQGRLTRCQQRLRKVQGLLLSAEEPDLAYLQNCMQGLLSKREQILQRAQELNRIEQEMEVLKDSVANMDTRPRETDLNNSKELDDRPQDRLEDRIGLRENGKGQQKLRDQLSADILSKEHRLEELEQAIADQEAQLKKVKDSQRKHSQRAVQEQVRLRNLERQTQSLQERAQALQQREATAAQQHSQLLNQISMLSHEKQRLEREVQQCQGRLRRALQKLQSTEHQLRASRLSQTSLGQKQRTLQQRCRELSAQYQQALQSVALLKQQQAHLLQDLQSQTTRNDRLVEQDRQLTRIVQQKYAELQLKLSQLQKCQSKLQQFTRHKDEMLHEFEQIEAQKTRLFEAVNEKEAQSKQIEQRKVAMEERIAKLEQEAHNYQRNFAEYNRRIEEHTMRLLELAQKEKATEAYLETLLKDEAEMLLRVAELEKVYSRLCVGVQLAGGHPDPRIGSLIKDKVDEIMSRLETLSSADKALHTERQLARKLKMQNDNLRALLN